MDQLKKRHDTEATVILDYLDECIVKNRGDEGTYDDFIWYVTKNYPEQMQELLKEYKSNVVS